MTFEEWFDSYCREIRRVYSEGARQEFAMTAKAILFQVVWDNGVTWDAKGEVAAKVMEWYNACEAMHCIHGASYKGPKITITESEAHAPATPATPTDESCQMFDLCEEFIDRLKSSNWTQNEISAARFGWMNGFQSRVAEAAPTTHCPDCDEAAKHAYSDATTPGFFSSKCSKHRREAGTQEKK